MASCARQRHWPAPYWSAGRRWRAGRQCLPPCGGFVWSSGNRLLDELWGAHGKPRHRRVAAASRCLRWPAVDNRHPDRRPSCDGRHIALVGASPTLRGIAEIDRLVGAGVASPDDLKGFATVLGVENVDFTLDRLGLLAGRDDCHVTVGGE